MGIQNIEKLITSLPKSDIELGYKFLKDRDFDSLQSLVSSALIRVRRGLSRECPKEEYLQVNLKDLNRLNAEVTLYCHNLEVPLMEGDIYEEVCADIDSIYKFEDDY